MASNRTDGFVFRQPQSFEERVALAKLLPQRLRYRIPVAIDPMDGRANRAYAAWPERIYVIARGGTVAYKAQPGPFGFKPDEAERSLARVLASGS